MEVTTLRFCSLSEYKNHGEKEHLFVFEIILLDHRPLCLFFLVQDELNDLNILVIPFHRERKRCSLFVYEKNYYIFFILNQKIYFYRTIFLLKKNKKKFHLLKSKKIKKKKDKIR